jgi:hypothetical protein
MRVSRYKFAVTKRLAGLVSITLIVAMTNAILGFSASNANRSDHPAKVTATRQAVSQLARLALSFEDHHKQSGREFDFVSRGGGATFLLNYAGPTIVLRPVEETRTSLAASRFHADRQNSKTTNLRLRLVGANRRAKTEKKGLLPGKTNYLIGNDARRWQTNLANYSRVSYRNIYPGTDVTYYGNGLQLEYDFTVKPGANPAAISLNFADAEKVEIDAGGNLKIKLNGGEVLQRKPFVHQEINGVGRALAGKYVMKTEHTVGFEVGSYDTSKPLVIDPVLVYSTYLGGSGSDQGTSVALDSAGKAYVTGITTSTDFPLTNGAAQSVKGGGSDVFVTKLDATGTTVVYSTYIGGANSDEGLSVSVDLSGSAYVTGLTDSDNFPTTAGALQTTRGGGADAFVVKLNSLGTGFSYATYLGGSLDDEAHGLAVDFSGNAYIAGVTDSTNFPTQNAFQPAKRSGSDAFISKLTFNGNALSFSSFLGGDDLDWAFAVSTDAADNVYVAGATNSTNFPATAGSFQRALAGTVDGFVTKITPPGMGPSAIEYATYLGGSGFDKCNALALDDAGNAYVTGLTDSQNFPSSAGTIQTARGGASDAFIAKFNTTGSALVYSTYLGGNSTDWGSGLSVDTAGQAYVTGSTSSSNFPVVPASAFQPALAGNSDAFIAKVNVSGTACTYSSYLGGSNFDDGLGIASDLARNAFVTGTTFSGNLPVTSGAFQTMQPGSGDAFLTKVSRQDAATGNEIDNVSFFVTQHYVDFLSRHPDAAGLAFWIDQITSCRGDQQCAAVRRINVSAAFFLSIEFQQTGYLVYRFNKVSFNAMPRYELFLPDTQQISRGVVVNAPGWEQLLAENQRAFAEAWVARPAFRAIYDPQSNSQYVDSLFANGGVMPGATERAALIDGLNGGTETRATVLRKVADNSILLQQESNRAFVLEQYFGYLRRNPDDSPDGNLKGFNFWLNKLNEFNGNFVNAEMVKAFIISGEYRQRFGP